MNATGSNSGVDGNDSNTTAGKTSPHGNSGRLQSVIGKQSSCMRKMSTMMEEEDASDDMDTEAMRIGQQHHQDADSDSPSEERGRLLSSSEMAQRITITPASSTSLYCNGLKKGIPRNDSGSSIHERSQRLQSKSGEQGQLETRLYRDIPQGVLRFNRGIDSHGRHRCSSVRSVKSNPTMDDHQYHPPAASWASIVFSDGNGQTHVRPFPESVSIRSLASIGMGSSDGRKLTIRRVPTSPSELLNMVHPPP